MAHFLFIHSFSKYTYDEVTEKNDNILMDICNYNVYHHWSSYTKSGWRHNSILHLFYSSSVTVND